MSLELFQQDNAADRDFAAHTSAPDLPATFGDTFSQALSESYFFGQSVSRENTRRSEIGGYADDIHKRLGTPDSVLTASAVTGDLDGVRKRAAELSAEHPDLQLPELTDDELERRMLAKSRDVRASSAAMSGREKTAGGVVGGFLGGVAGGGSDPVNVITFPLAAPAGLGILKTGLAWAGIAGGTQAAIEQIAAPWHDVVEPGYSASPEPAANILGSAATGGAIGMGIKGVANAWARLKTGEWPRTIRDAGNAVESEANIAETNPFGSSVEAETAHRAAVSKAVDDLVDGKPVEVEDIVGSLRFKDPRIEALDSELNGLLSKIKLAEQQGDEAAIASLKAQGDELINKLEAKANGDGEFDAMLRDDAKRKFEEFLAAKNEYDKYPKDGFPPSHVADNYKDASEALVETFRLTGLPGDRMGRVRPVNSVDDIQQAFREASRAEVQSFWIKSEVAPTPRQTELPLQKPVSASERAAHGELADNLTRKAVNDVRADPLTDDAVTVDLDRLRAEKDVQVPVGETIGPDGKPTVLMRSIDSVIDEIDQRIKAANEIKACAGPQSEAAE